MPDSEEEKSNTELSSPEAIADRFVVDGWKTDDPLEAENLFRKAINAAPGHWRGYYALGNLFSSRNCFDDAVEMLHFAAQRALDEPAVHHAYGLVLFARDEIDVAVSAFKYASELDPQNRGLLRSLALGYIRQGNSQGALKIFWSLLDSDPFDYETFKPLADHLTHIRKFSELQELSAKFIDRYPDERSAWGHHARSQSFLGRKQVAKAICEHIERVFPDWSFNTFLLGQVFAKLGSSSSAKEQFERTIELDPTNAGAHYELGNLLLEDKKIIEGGLSYLEAINANHRYAGGHSGIGWVFLRANLYEPALSAFGKALGYDPFLADGWTGLGIVALKREDAFCALFYFTRALEIEDTHEIANCGIGDAYVDIGSDQLAEPAYRTAVEGHPFSVIALSRLADLVDRDGRHEEAKSLRKRLAGLKNPPSMALIEEIDSGINEIKDIVEEYLSL